MIDILTNQIYGVANNAIFNSVYQFTGGIQTPELRAAVSRVAEELSVFAINTSGTTIRSSLPTYQRDLQGIYNPFDQLTSTSRQSSINNSLIGIYGKQISSQVENKAVMLVRDNLRGFFPSNSFINFDVLTDTIIQMFSPSLAGIVEMSVATVGSNYFVRNSVDFLSNGITNATSIYGAIQDLSNIRSPWELLFIGNVVGSAITDAQKFILGSQGDNNKLQVLNRGFIDPSATYPLPEYAGRSDVNKLAQGDPSNTIVIEKDKTRVTGAPLPGGGSIEQPVSPFKGEYPYNKVNQTESGHIIEIDDTPGAERLHIYHKSGTFIEIDSNGTVVKRAIGSSYEIIDKNGKISIAGKADVSVNGACNIFVGNDANIQVDGDATLTCFNDITAQAGGTLNLTAKEEINIVSEKINMTSLGEINVLAETDLKLSGQTSVDVKSDGSMTINSSESMGLKSNKDLLLTSKDSMGLKSDKDVAINSALDARVSSDKNVILHPSGGIMLSGTAVQVTTEIGKGTGPTMKKYIPDNSSIPGVVDPTYDKSNSAENASKAPKSQVGLLAGRKDIIPIDLKDPTPLSHVDNVSLLVDEEGQDADEHRNNLIIKGITSAEIFDRIPVSSESESNLTVVKTSVMPASTELLNLQELPGNYRITPNFTIDMVSAKAAVTKDTIVRNDLTYGQIAYNLQALALNVLEPAYALYPNLLITSGYRNQNRSINTSQHPKGQAVDLQFRGSHYDDYYEIAVRLAQAISFDQFILEYTSYSRNPWIHVSFSKDKNRNSILTFWNNKKYSNGLHRLS